MKKKVLEIKNLKEKNLQKKLKDNSDCLLGFSGVYKKENNKNIPVSKQSEADVCIYNNMETGEIIEIPVDYVDEFEKTAHIFRLEPVVITPEMSKKYEERIKKRQRTRVLPKTVCSNR